MRILQKIHGHDDLLHLNDKDRECLCQEIREFLVSNVSKTGGHLASNLGVVELSVALETVFDTAKDRLVFDVGHQSYVHKLLTGRQADFARLRQIGGMAGFPKPGESDTDAFVAGHASSSISIALGMARARSLRNEHYHVVALLGDGAATGGMVFEALNDAAVSREPLIVILNDNAMSIDRNVGGLARHLSHLRSTEEYLSMKRRVIHAISKLPKGEFLCRVLRRSKDWLKRLLLPASSLFENMGITYLGPVDGHDLPELIGLLRVAKEFNRPVLIHVQTRKGRGYLPAEEEPARFHGIGQFDPLTGRTLKKSGPSFSQVFGETMEKLAAEDSRVCAITAAMPSGTGLLNFKKRYPTRTFDVGIAEEHAVSMAGGLAKQGMVPVVAIYSTFLQRSYDMILQDIAMLHLHVVLGVDRAGLVGEDGETHHGIFDLGFLRQAPGMTVLCPVSLAELRDMLVWAVKEQDGPVAIRYPRGGDRSYDSSDWKASPALLTEGSVACHRQGRDVTLVTYGTILENVMAAAEVLEANGIQATVLRLLTAAPLPIEGILEAMPEEKPVVVVEEICGSSGIREALAWELRRRKPSLRVDGLDLGHNFVTHGEINALYRHYGLDRESIAHFVEEVLRHEN